MNINVVCVYVLFSCHGVHICVSVFVVHLLCGARVCVVCLLCGAHLFVVCLLCDVGVHIIWLLWDVYACVVKCQCVLCRACTCICLLCGIRLCMCVHVIACGVCVRLSIHVFACSTVCVQVFFDYCGVFACVCAYKTHLHARGVRCEFTFRELFPSTPVKPSKPSLLQQHRALLCKKSTFDFK